ncbi:MAG: ABC transporter permease [Flavobacteriales bacterium]|nr:ABC transporter permease [Flavobacteriales bacterium]MBL6873851.1 ABC transporter permease [Flavobacteriales bacterium]
MNLDLFIAKRLIGKNEYRFSRPVLRIAITAIALSVSVMLLSLSIIKGFQNEIRDKVIGLSSHIQVTDFSDSNSYESTLLANSDSLKQLLINIEGITHIQSYATKAGILKTKDEIQGVVLKGVNKDFNPKFLESKLIAGKIPSYGKGEKSNSIVLSNTIAKQLNLELEDDIQMYFIQQPVRVRKFSIAGIYETGIAEYDNMLVIGDIKHIQKLNKWTNEDVGALEIQIENFEDLELMTQLVYSKIGYSLNAKNVIDSNPQLFDWLDLQNLNIKVILILMLLVGAINMVTALFILILEQTPLIGTLKSLGSSNWTIRKIFLYHSAYLISKGLLYGNIIGISLALIQKKFQLISLNPETYYMSFIPIDLNWLNFLALNIGTLLICLAILIVPSYLISRINPVSAIRFE